MDVTAPASVNALTDETVRVLSSPFRFGGSKSRTGSC